MSSTDLAWMSATDLVTAYRARTLSPVEATQAVLERAERLNPTLNAFCLIDPESALASARLSEARWAKGQPIGLVDGVPVSVKDIILTKGWPTLRGSRTVNPDQPWDEDGPAVARLREQGAVLFGKTTTPEFAAKAVTRSPLTGTTLNPWDVTRTPGGSSGGAGAAVAAGIGPMALATDAGGSIRLPASFSGVFGHKPSGGRVPMYPPTPYGSLAGFGPMTRTVADAALMMSVITGFDPREWGILPPDGTQYHEQLAADPAAWRIAWSPTLCGASVDPQVAALTERAAQAFAAMGANVETVEHVFDDPLPVLNQFQKGLTHFAFRTMGEAQFALMDPDLVATIRASHDASLDDHLEAEMARAALGRRMIAFHQTYDLLLTPTVGVPPFSADLDRPAGAIGKSWYPITFPFNLTRQPAASVPCGFTAEGLPVGLQIVGPPHRDLLVLQAAHAFEQVLPWQQHRPALAL
ncbi:MAG: amidase [Alphaproteobacteria bacterium]|nr:amidase [Alphaproteobacteria bacterium]